MDIARPDLAISRARRRRWIGVALALAVGLVAWGLSRLEAAAPVSTGAAAAAVRGFFSRAR